MEVCRFKYETNWSIWEFKPGKSTKFCWIHTRLKWTAIYQYREINIPHNVFILLEIYLWIWHIPDVQHLPHFSCSASAISFYLSLFPKILLATARKCGNWKWSFFSLLPPTSIRYHSVHNSNYHGAFIFVAFTRLE